MREHPELTPAMRQGYLDLLDARFAELDQAYAAERGTEADRGPVLHLWTIGSTVACGGEPLATHTGSTSRLGLITCPACLGMVRPDPTAAQPVHLYARGGRVACGPVGPGILKRSVTRLDEVTCPECLDVAAGPAVTLRHLWCRDWDVACGGTEAESTSRLDGVSCQACLAELGGAR